MQGWHRHFPALALALWIALAAGVSAAQAGKRALVVGIAAYPEEKLRLDGPVNDARDIARFLREHAGYGDGEIRLMLDGEATRANILAALDRWLIGGSKPGDTLVFYYSGHGSRVPDADGDEPDGCDEAIVPVDIGSNRRTNLIVDDELKALFGGVADRLVTVIMDSCFAGTATRSVQPPAATAPGAKPRTDTRYQPACARAGLMTPQQKEALRRKEPSIVGHDVNRTVWAAAGKTQEAFEVEIAGTSSGVFTRAFIEGIAQRKADRDGDGIVTHIELWDWVTSQADAACQGIPRCRPVGQTPWLEIARGRTTDPVMTTLRGDARAERPLQQMAILGLQPGPAPAAPPLAPASGAPAAGPPRVVVRTLAGGAPRSDLQVGELVTFEVTASFDGWLTLFEIGPSSPEREGKLVQLFPNPHATAEAAGRLRAGQRFAVPDAAQRFAYRMKAPTGTGRVVAVVTQDRVDLSAVAGSSKGLTVVPDARDYVAELAQLLRQPWTGEASADRPARYAIGATDYSLRP